MSTFYLDRRNLMLKIESGTLVVHQNGIFQTRVPLKMLDRVVIRGNAELSTSTLAELSSNGIGFLVISGRRGDKIAQLTGSLHNDTNRRINQYSAYADRLWRSHQVQRTVAAKLNNQQRLVEKMLLQRPDARRALTKAKNTIQGIRHQLEESSDIDQIRGFEGAAAAAFFKAYTAVLPASLGFSGRNRRPPKDPVNACLSLAYTLLNSDAVHTCHIVGLDPAIGALHEPAFGRPSLAADMIEPLRPHVDEWVWYLFRERVLENHHFSQDGDACLLIKNGRQRFYTEWEARAPALRRLLRLGGHALVKTLAEATNNATAVS